MLKLSSHAQGLYEAIAHEPIIDFHTHLPQGEILTDKRFAHITELWLEHDHYKWRLMRACGIEEALITGDAEPMDKFRAFASCLPLALGNPVDQWAHMELETVFGIKERLGPESANHIWEEANSQLQDRWSVRGLLDFFRVELVCTTDDPAADLSQHEALQEIAPSPELMTRVLPTFRPDRFCSPHQPELFAAAIAELGQRNEHQITNIDDLLSGLKQRHNAFHEAGCRMSDHGLPTCPTTTLTEAQLKAIFEAALNGKAATEAERDGFAAHLMQQIARWNTEAGWTMQLHLGPLRNVNSRLFAQTGPDSGLDTIGTWEQTRPLIEFLNKLTQAASLPKTIVYHLDPTQSEPIASALQSFQQSGTSGWVQYGPAWWHCDHVPGIRRQLQVLSSLSALGAGLGMLTDSRSFTSMVRHDYFRRILVNYLAEEAEAGAMPANKKLLTDLARGLSGANARRYLGFES